MKIVRESPQRVVLHLERAPEPIWVESSVPFAPAYADFALWLSLLWCTDRQIPVVIDEPITDTAHFNAKILQRYLHRYLGWKPVEIHAEVVDLPEPEVAIGGKVLTPFSGGIDSAFTVFYNSYAMHRPVHAAFFCGGLDIPWRKEREINLACERCERMLSAVQVPLFRLKTNYRDVNHDGSRWPLESDVVLAGLLHLFDKDYRHGLISGSGDGGVDSVPRWFQMPRISDRLHHLFTGATMIVDSYSGAMHDKIQKAGYVAQFPVIREDLRVCWINFDHQNCGRCGKCFISQLFLLAALGEIPRCFPVQMSGELIEGMVRRAAAVEASQVGRYESDEWYYTTHWLAPTLKTAAYNRVTHPLLDVLAKELRDGGFIPGA